MAGKAAPEQTERQYRLTYRVRPPASCPVRDASGTVSDVTVFVNDDKRRCELLVQGETGTLSVERHGQSTDHSCPCSVVIENGAIPHLKPGGEPGYLEVSLYVAETKAAQAITDGLESVASDVELIDYAALDSADTIPVRLDLGSLTEKRRAALRRAITNGYYETPSQTTIEEMAEAAGISSSAFATRLRKAEQEVFEQIRRSL